MNTPLSTPSNEYVSIFDRVFDVVVVGAGLIGFAAACSLARSGRSVALVESSGDLIWEATRALENRIGSGQPSGAWAEWLDTLRKYDGVSNGCFDSALAEILAARELLALRSRLSVLFYAVPVAVEAVEGMQAAVTVATKGGFRVIRACQWVDASEPGWLAALWNSGHPCKVPTRRFCSLALQSCYWSELESKIRDLFGNCSGIELLPSARKTERRLLIPIQAQGRLFGGTWDSEALRIISELRRALPENSILVSHLSLRDWPVYPVAGIPFEAPPNLLVMSPAWQQGAFSSAGERFSAGAAVRGLLEKLPKIKKALPDICASVPVAAEVSSDVLVAGTGTAGAVAAIASARAGARTLALDLSGFPGGIGAGGGINVYFHGSSGGLQDELDARTARISAMLGMEIKPSVWHHDAKKLAICELFRESGVEFRGETLLCGAERDETGRVSSVLAVEGNRLTRYRARGFIDSTGDGDLCVLAGAEFLQGRPGDCRTLSYSQVAHYLKEEKGTFSIGIINYDAGWVDATDPEDLTRARLEGIAFHLYETWPVADRPFLLAPLLGIRQSRQILSDAQITINDLVERRRFPDAVGIADAIADTHSVDFEFESDEMLFYLWVCEGFHEPLRCELPYRMLLPRGLKNVWIAGRAAGVDVNAAYCVRMQRDMQRLGEVAGVAAAQMVREAEDSRHVDWARLRKVLEQSGAAKALPEETQTDASDKSLLALLDRGETGVYLWKLANRPQLLDAVASRLHSSNPFASYHAAAILAFCSDARSEERLLQAIELRETGERPGGVARGAYGQRIDIPFWLLAIALLRMGGTQHCVGNVSEFVTPEHPFNVRTLAALTLERLAIRYGALPEIMEAMKRLILEAESVSDAFLPPSRSLRKMLDGEVPDFSPSWGVDVRQDHSWQLALITARLSKRLGLGFPGGAARYLHDPRAYVRHAFRSLAENG